MEKQGSIFGNEKETKIDKKEPAIIQLGLMNGELIKLPLELIDCLQIFGISENHYVTKELPFVDKYKYCSRAFIKLSKAVVARFYSKKNDATILDRLTQLNDISEIIYLNQNGKFIDRILVPWKDMTESGLENKNQFSCVDSKGNLEISIKG